MSNLLSLQILPLLWLLLGHLFGLAYPAIGSRITGLSPQRRLLFQLTYSLLPLLIATSVAVMVFTPLIGGVNLSSHCHGLTCAPHVPVLQADPVSSAILYAALSLAGIATLISIAVSLWRNHRTAGVLCRLSSKGIDNTFNVLETSDPVACCIGILRPHVLISRGVLERASMSQLQVIVCHELAHAYRLDNLRRLFSSVVTFFWPDRSRRRLLADIELAGEQCCDEEVAYVLGNRALIADTIRTYAGWHCVNGMIAGGWENRVARLVSQTAEDLHGWKLVTMVFMGSAIFTLIASDTLHRVAEALLSVVPVIY